MQSTHLDAIRDQILAGMSDPRIDREAAQRVETCRHHGLVSDWEPCPDKVLDFSRLVVSAAQVLPPGGGVETGVLRGGTAGLLMLAATPESFLVAIDPYGLPTQSYPDLAHVYGAWPEARQTISTLHSLGTKQNVTFCHYLMNSQAFAAADHLRHPGTFRIIHLDGDHSRETVVQELTYFRDRVKGPALFILDDHCEHFPGVDEALQIAGKGLVRVLHRFYEFENAGQWGFSAWLHQQNGHSPRASLARRVGLFARRVLL
jgi:hypothetical protein